MLDSSILTDILSAYVTGASQGFPIIQGYAHSLFYKLLIIEIMLFGIGLALGKIDFRTEIVAKILAIGFVQFLLFRYVWLIDVVRDGFLHAGLAASGNNLSIPEFLDPSSYVTSGFLKIASLMGEQFDRGIWTYLNSPGAIWLLYGLALFTMFVAYVGVGLLIFLVVVEFYLISSLAIILLPFLIVQKTSFLGFRAINSLLSICIRLMVIAFVSGLSVPVFELLTITSNEPTIKEALSLALGALAIALIMWKAPSIALSMIAGSGGLDVNQTIVQPMMSAISTAAQGSGLVSRIGSFSSNAVSSVGKAAAEGVRHAKSIIK